MVLRVTASSSDVFGSVTFFYMFFILNLNIDFVGFLFMEVDETEAF